jgi:hypothetical protein
MHDTTLPSAKRTRRHRLTPRDRQILQHVARYRLITTAVVHRLFLSRCRPNAAGKLVARLCRLGHLQKQPLLHRRQYYLLGPRATQLLGLGEHRSQPLGPQALPSEYAVLAYAALGKQHKLRLTSNELRQRCHWLPATLTQAPHCWDEAGNCLELVRVDLGGPADHVARKCLADLRQRLRIAEFAAIVAAQRFRLIVVTATKEKAAAIRKALDQHEVPPGLQLHFSIVPDLLSLAARRSDA